MLQFQFHSVGRSCQNPSFPMADEGAQDAQPEALASDDGSWELPESESDVPDADPVERVEPSFRNEAATHNDGHGHAGFTSTANTKMPRVHVKRIKKVKHKHIHNHVHITIQHFHGFHNGTPTSVDPSAIQSDGVTQEAEAHQPTGAFSRLRRSNAVLDFEGIDSDWQTQIRFMFPRFRQAHAWNLIYCSWPAMFPSCLKLWCMIGALHHDSLLFALFASLYLFDHLCTSLFIGQSPAASTTDEKWWRVGWRRLAYLSFFVFMIFNARFFLKGRQRL